MNFKKITFLIIFLFTNISIAQQDIEIERKYTLEIERLVKNKKIKAAFAKIKELEPKTMKRHISLTEIPSPPFKESKRAAAFANHFKELGVDSLWIDSEGNVLGLFKGSKGNRTIALDAHLDTVFPDGTDVKVNIKNDTLFAPGIGDDTRGLSMILTLIETMKATGIKPKENILFIGSV